MNSLSSAAAGPAIAVRDLGKAYRIGVREERSDTFAGVLASFASGPMNRLRSLNRLNTFGVREEGADLHWALREVSFSIERGEVVGFIGRNGAGKSTLLKLLSRIARPTEGRLEMRGRVASLLEVGTGFHPELTGRENIFMNGTVLGMTNREIRRKFDEIVAFSGVEKFLETPVKRYSSGMKVRLGFSVAAHLEPETLIIDEVLAVGDAEFQRRCLGKMRDTAAGGRTVLFVSHNMGAVRNLCTRCISLADGRLIEDGPPDQVIGNYLAAFSAPTSNAFTTDNPDRKTSGPVRMMGGRIRDASGNLTSTLVSGEPATFEVDLQADEGSHRCNLRLILRDGEGLNLGSLDSGLESGGVTVDSTRTIRVTVPRLPLPLGEYSLGAAVIGNDHSLSDQIPAALPFTVDTATFFTSGRTPPARLGRLLLEQKWDFSQEYQRYERAD